MTYIIYDIEHDEFFSIKSGLYLWEYRLGSFVHFHNDVNTIDELLKTLDLNRRPDRMVKKKLEERKESIVIVPLKEGQFLFDCSYR